MPSSPRSREYKPQFTHLSGQLVVYENPPDFGGRCWSAKVHTRGDLAGVGEVLAIMSKLDRLPAADPIRNASTAVQVEVKTEPLRLTVPFRRRDGFFYGVLPPSAHDYINLVQSLVKVANNTSVNPLVASVNLMAALEEYFLNDHISAAAGLFRPLITLSVAARELSAGGNPQLLRPPKLPGVTRPTNKHEHTINACLAVAVYVLVESGLNKEQAIASLAATHDIHDLMKRSKKKVENGPKSDLAQIYDKANDGTGPKKMVDGYRAILYQLHSKIEVAVASTVSANQLVGDILNACRLNAPLRDLNGGCVTKRR